MEQAVEYGIVGGILLLFPAAVQWKWSRRRAIGIVGVLIGLLTFLYSSIEWGGTPDERMSRGFLTIFGWIASGLAVLASLLMFMWNPPKPAANADGMDSN